jgi:hypothetical protein
VSDDVRQLGLRVAKLVNAMVLGGAATVPITIFAERISRHGGTAAGTWFVFCSAVFGFLLCSGVALALIELFHRRAIAPPTNALPRAIVRLKRSRSRTSCKRAYDLRADW